MRHAGRGVLPCTFAVPPKWQKAVPARPVFPCGDGFSYMLNGGCKRLIMMSRIVKTPAVEGKYLASSEKSSTFAADFRKGIRECGVEQR